MIQTRLEGQDIVDYVLNAGVGQRMVIDLGTDNPSAYFNLMPSGDPQAIHMGSSAGNHFDGTLPASGDWVIRVYLIRAAARRNETANITLSIHIGGASHSVPAADLADGAAGGPDYWQVAGLTGGDTLNVRSRPGTTHQVVSRVHSGQVFRNLGCRGSGPDRWCHVESGNGLISGWVAGRFLRESGAPASPSPSLPVSSFADGDAGGPDFWEVTGVAAGDYLNIRTGPATRYSIVARAPNGLTLRNLGCRGTGSDRWCHVQTPDGGYDGWVSGRYLREGGAPAASGPGIQIPSGSNISPDLYLRPTGEIEVGWAGGCTVLYNPAHQRIQAGSSCSSAQLTLSDAAVARFD
ncbi:SH3 domain-containing protein [Sedimentitalea xiamensis]|uniref:SH3 domain-containing protein n=1 Tax=Sedimentitalea xiamensis TaxID=3050037 RepID=UPI00254261FF|nr:SH3 domain-containing protein [Sedimentitalea xiamensis]